MAIENAKTLNVRIKNKYDSYENWAASGLVLEAGEIAIAYTTVNVDVGNGTIEQHPELLMKVGNGSDTFKDLPWLSAKAADVAAWAKAADKPTYEAKEITGMEQYIADYVKDEMGISVDTDTLFQIVKVDDYNYKLQSKGKSDEAWADVADSVIVIPNDTEAIEALQELVGEESVATQITNAIADLDLANTYAAKTHTHVKADITDFAHTHTKSEITDFAHTHEMSEVNGLTEALAGKETAGEAAKVQSALNEYKTSNDAAVKKVSDDLAAEILAARAAEEANAGAIDDLEALVGVIPEGATASTVVGYIDEKTANIASDSTVSAIGDRVTELEGLVGDTAVATQISTAVAAEAEIARAAEQANADAIDAIEADYLKTADKTELQDNIDALEERVTSNEEAIEVLNGSGEGSVAKAIDDAFNDFAAKVSDDNVVNTYKELIDYAADNGSEVTTLVGKVGTLETEMDEAQADITALETAVGTKAAQADLEALTGRVTTAEGKVSTLEGEMDTAQEDIAALETKVGDTPVADQITAAIEALKIGDYAKAADLTAAINQHNTDKAALEAEIAEKANDADLAAIAKTGSTDDLVQGSMVLVFDCGSSAN